MKEENGRKFFVKHRPGKNGGWDKKVFLDELTNPYESADQPEMLRKAAGKSFLRKYARVRNSEAAMAEMSEENADVIDDVLERSLNYAMDQFPEEPAPTPEPKQEPEIVQDAEVVEEQDSEPEQGELQIDD